MKKRFLTWMLAGVMTVMGFYPLQAEAIESSPEEYGKVIYDIRQNADYYLTLWDMTEDSYVNFYWMCNDIIPKEFLGGREDCELELIESEYQIDLDGSIYHNFVIRDKETNMYAAFRTMPTLDRDYKYDGNDISAHVIDYNIGNSNLKKYHNEGMISLFSGNDAMERVAEIIHCEKYEVVEACTSLLYSKEYGWIISTGGACWNESNEPELFRVDCVMNAITGELIDYEYIQYSLF